MLYKSENTSSIIRLVKVATSKIIIALYTGYCVSHLSNDDIRIPLTISCFEKQTTRNLLVASKFKHDSKISLPKTCFMLLNNT